MNPTLDRQRCYENARYNSTPVTTTGPKAPVSPRKKQMAVKRLKFTPFRAADKGLYSIGKQRHWSLTWGANDQIHALTDEIGRLYPLLITAGNVHDLDGAHGLLATGLRPKSVIADRAYDARSLRQELAQRRIKAVILPNPTRKHPHRYHKNAYKRRNVIERMFCRLKDFRRIATRCDKRADNFLSAILLAVALTWWIN